MPISEIFFSGGPVFDLESYFSLVEGIESCEVVYIDGNSEYTTHDEVYSGSGHVEAIRLIFNEKVVSLLDLVHLFIILFDPFRLDDNIKNFPNHQRVGIFSFVDDDIDIIRGFFENLQELHGEEATYYSRYIEEYCVAEEEYQDYLNKNPEVECNIGVDKLTRAYNYMSRRDWEF
ncbi:MAG: peptide-methionine (S)-S-oxide reductase [Firmicutes bacterium]|nr:peptide-methionine (S)-S-oxide reductase [Bacillota bacterium]